MNNSTLGPTEEQNETTKNIRDKISKKLSSISDTKYIYPELKIKISPDNMKAVITEYDQSKSNTLFTIPPLVSALQNKGVFYGITRKSLKEFFSRLQTGASVLGLVIATGNMPVPAQDAQFKLSGNINFPIYPGECIGIIEPAKPCHKGRNIKGKYFMHPNIKQHSINNIRVECGENCYFDEDTGEFISEIYGMVAFTGSSVSVAPLIKIADNKMSVSGKIYPQNFNGGEPTLVKIRRSILQNRLGMPPSSKSLIQAIDKAIKNRTIVEVEMIKGKLPKAGAHGIFKLEPSSIQPFPISGQFRNYPKIIFSIKANRLIGSISFPDSGSAGMDVHGTVIIPPASLHNFILTSNNIKIDFQQNSFHSCLNGIVIYYNNELELSPLNTIKHFEPVTADAHIFEYDQSVLFNNSSINDSNLRITGHAFFNGSVNKINLHAERDVIVRDSIAQSDITADTIVCHQTVGSVLHSREDVIFQNKIEASNIYAEYRIIGKARRCVLRGGTYKAGLEIQACRTGSNKSEKTEIILGYGHNLEEHITHVIDNIEKTILRYRNYLDYLNGLYDSGQFYESQTNIINYRTLCLKEIKNLKLKIKKIRNDYSPYIPRLKVCENFFPGTTVTIFDQTYSVTATLKSGVFTFIRGYGIKYLPDFTI